MSELTIIGRGPSWKECPFCTEELWGAASCLITEGLKDKNYTKVFAFDDMDTPARIDELGRCMEIANSRNIPIVSTRAYATEIFPLVEIAREFWSSYFMPTASYMMAYALYLKYGRLHIYGLDQGPRWIYQSGKPHIVHWLGVALGRKVDLRIGRGSLRWAYRLGLNEVPIAFFEDDESSIAKNIGLAIREQEIVEAEEIKNIVNVSK